MVTPFWVWDYCPMKEKKIDKEKLEMAKILKDLVEERNDNKRMRENPNLLWKIRGFLSTIEYWILAFSFWVSIAIWIVTGDYWKGIAYYLTCQIYAVAANFRGLTLHLETLIEWLMKKRI